MAVALAGALLIITKGQASVGTGLSTGDLLALLAMLGWAGYTLMQNRVGQGVSFLARIGLFAAAGALFSLPFYAVTRNPSTEITLLMVMVYGTS
jgi:drug/metabolite transporter (DMT)-like permease